MQSWGMKEHPLRRYRREHNLTLEQGAVAVGTTLGTISRIESRQLNATHELLIKLSGETGISIDELVRASTRAA